jgi:hypothetical protein
LHLEGHRAGARHEAVKLVEAQAQAHSSRLASQLQQRPSGGRAAHAVFLWRRRGSFIGWRGRAASGSRNEQRIRANSDMRNLLASVQIASVIASSGRRIRRFTPMTERVLHRIAADVGRPIGHIKPNIDLPELEQRIAPVIESVSPCECQVKDRQGSGNSLRIRPCKKMDNRIDGAVLALFDIHVVVQRHRDRRDAEEDGALHVIREPLLVVDAECAHSA